MKSGNRTFLFIVLVLAAGCSPEKCDWIAQRREVTESQRDIEALTLKSAYDHDMEEWRVCHSNLSHPSRDLSRRSIIAGISI